MYWLFLLSVGEMRGSVYRDECTFSSFFLFILRHLHRQVHRAYEKYIIRADKFRICSLPFRGAFAGAWLGRTSC